MSKYVRAVKNIALRECSVGRENSGAYTLMFVEKSGKTKLTVCICYAVIAMNYNNLLEYFVLYFHDLALFRYVLVDACMLMCFG